MSQNAADESRRLDRIERKLDYLTDLVIQHCVNDPAQVAALNEKLRVARESLQQSMDQSQSPKS